MKPPVRKVCGGCLRSVELPGSGSANGEIPSINECPFCGGEIDSKSDPDSPTDEPLDRTPAGNVFSPISEISGETVGWAETWNRGTLGVIGRFQLRERLGEGGFGQVFQAFDPRLDRDVALKVLRQPNPSERIMQRFFREARAAARLDHPNIVAVHDAGFENGRCWIAYQYISGRPLWWYRNHHSPDHLTSARIIRDLADALDHAHRQGVLHRDLKPANVIMDDQGRPRLTDFGLARRADLDSSLTRDGAMVGTPAYMSPEQAQGNSKNVDERSDLYSLGVIFHELLHGHRPRESEDEPEPSPSSTTSSPRVVYHFPRPRRVRPTVPAALQRICDKALASSLDDRYPNARSLVEDLDRWLFHERARATKTRPHRNSLVAAAAVALLTFAGLGIAFAPLRTRGPQANDAAAAPPTKLEAPAEIPKLAPQKEPEPPLDTRKATSKTEAPASKTNGRFVGNRETSIYHRLGSACVKHMADRNRVSFEQEVEAAKSGYRGCDKCFRE